MSGLTLPEAEVLAAATLAAIAEDDAEYVRRFGHRPPPESPRERHRAIDRERIASDLDGLRAHVREYCEERGACPDIRRYSDGLRRTARLYGVDAPRTRDVTRSAPATPSRGSSDPTGTPDGAERPET